MCWLLNVRCLHKSLIDCYSDFSLSSFVAHSANLINICIRHCSHSVPPTIINHITTFMKQLNPVLQLLKTEDNCYFS